MMFSALDAYYMTWKFIEEENAEKENRNFIAYQNSRKAKEKRRKNKIKRKKRK